MRIVAESLSSTSQLLIRLLADADSDVILLGDYLVANVSTREFSFSISSDHIKNGEAHIFITGYWPLPAFISITCPDLTIEKVAVVKVRQDKYPVLIDQPIETIKPIEQELLRPGEGLNPYTPIKVLPSEYPKFWIDLDFERTDPLRLGEGVASDSVVYLGGCQGRVLSDSKLQLSQDAAPYLNYAPVRLEGQFNNSLFNSTFDYSPMWQSPHFDPQPNGWSIDLSDALSLIRIKTDTSRLLPIMSLSYRPRSSNLDNSFITKSTVTVLSPEIHNAGETFQVLVVVGKHNTQGKLRLKTFDDAIVSDVYNLIPGTTLAVHLNISTHVGRVKLLWDQMHADDDAQILHLVAPCASLYTGIHSWLPTGSISFADLVYVNNLSFNKVWFFQKGEIRVNGDGDNLEQPLSWKLSIGSQILLEVDGGVLRSDFMHQPLGVLLSNHLTSVISYRLVWSSPTSFKLTDILGRMTSELPFTLDISVINLDMPLSLEFAGYKSNEGSNILKHWVFSPK